jgi:hypothetical protein
MRGWTHNAPVRSRLLGLVVGSWALACSHDSTPGSSAQAAELPAPSATPKAARSAAPAPADAAAATEPAELEAPLSLRTDAGTVGAASALRVLHVGDSMVPLVGNYLRPIFWRSKRDYWIESVTSSSTLEWGGDKRLLQAAMYKYNPDLILISLGSNELFDANPERRAPAIRQIVADTRGRACLWIGPPAWKRDFGFIDVLRKNLGTCRYLDSTKLRLPRMADGRHPDWTGGHAWASAVWRALGATDAVPTGSPRPIQP